MNKWCVWWRLPGDAWPSVWSIKVLDTEAEAIAYRNSWYCEPDARALPPMLIPWDEQLQRPQFEAVSALAARCAELERAVVVLRSSRKPLAADVPQDADGFLRWLNDQPSTPRDDAQSTLATTARNALTPDGKP